MRCFIAFFFALTFSFFAFAENDSCSVVSFDNDDCPLKGRVKIVDNFEDLKVEIVDNFENFVVEVVDNYWEEHDCGTIELVENFENIKIKVVKNFADVKIRFRNKESKERFIKAFKSIK